MNWVGNSILKLLQTHWCSASQTTPNIWCAGFGTGWWILLSRTNWKLVPKPVYGERNARSKHKKDKVSSRISWSLYRIRRFQQKPLSKHYGLPHRKGRVSPGCTWLGQLMKLKTRSHRNCAINSTGV